MKTFVKHYGRNGQPCCNQDGYKKSSSKRVERGSLLVGYKDTSRTTIDVLAVTCRKCLRSLAKQVGLRADTHVGIIHDAMLEAGKT